jgi:hypothetical protein
MLLCWINGWTQHDRTNGSKTVNALTTIAMIALLALAIYLAIRDLNFLQHTSTKVFILLLAILYPDLYVLLHGISTSSVGLGFFSGAPVTPLSGGTPYTPYTPMGGAGSSSSYLPPSAPAAAAAPSMPASAMMMAPTPSSMASSDWSALGV